ncbi:MAG: tyrosine-type recombinase/integrase [Lamprobacter sp.]|uniref:tyrosine-type recombinase/integrase n=1 Tax=Lamprobacter sp. TaxID=3100796 RepID=UPI002B25993E|nr:tyrosine-type recombinase/integrase [Lamprobacter sp.]MEA3643470.1 tyrosine-type recombinase/integrase [Lamprobacter sp.]
MGKLTVKQLESLTVDDIGRKLFDGEGLYGRVRTQKAGIVVSFEYRFKQQGRTRTTACGKWPNESLKNIRKTRDGKQALLDVGTDPVEQGKAEKLRKQFEDAQSVERYQAELTRMAAEAAARRTFKDALEQWGRAELSRRKDGGKESMRAIEKDILPALGGVALVDLKRSMLVDALDIVVERGARVMANHLYGDLRQFFNFALAREWIETHPLAGLTKEKIGGRQKERERYLSEDEIIDLKRRLPLANLLHTTALSIWIMLSTCCRVGELSQARWADLDLDEGEWSIPAGNSKNAKEHKVYLSDFANAQFRALKTLTDDSDWCLPARDRTAHICLKSITKQIKDRMRDEPLSNRTKATGALLLSGGAWTPHDLRRTGATMMDELGVIGEVIERCLNHVEQNKLKRIYQRHELKAEQRDAWRRLGSRLALLVEHEEHSTTTS